MITDVKIVLISQKNKIKHFKYEIKYTILELFSCKSKINFATKMINKMFIF